MGGGVWGGAHDDVLFDDVLVKSTSILLCIYSTFLML